MALAAAALAAGALGACESTQSRSARLERESRTALEAETGLEVTRRSRSVRVVGSSVIQDANGTAAVVELRNASKRALAAIPVAIEVRGPAESVLYANDQPGLDASLTSAPLLAAGERLVWVNDQVTAVGKAVAVRARVGARARRAPERTPRIAIRDLRLENDPGAGLAGVGRVVNRSTVEQRRLVIFAVARRGGEVVAAGRAIVQRLKPGRAARFTVFFIGNPRGARLEAAAPPTDVKDPR